MQPLQNPPFCSSTPKIPYHVHDHLGVGLPLVVGERDWEVGHGPQYGHQGLDGVRVHHGSERGQKYSSLQYKIPSCSKKVNSTFSLTGGVHIGAEALLAINLVISLPMGRRGYFTHSTWAGIFKESMGAGNRGGIGLSYRPARLHRLAEFIPWYRFLASINVKKYGLCVRCAWGGGGGGLPPCKKKTGTPKQ